MHVTESWKEIVATIACLYESTETKGMSDRSLEKQNVLIYSPGVIASCTEAEHKGYMSCLPVIGVRG